MLCHRKPACRLSMETSICYKMAFPGSSAWKCSFYGRKLIRQFSLEMLILRPQIDRGSGFQPLLEPAKPVLRMVDERAKALSYFSGVCRQAEVIPGFCSRNDQFFSYPSPRCQRHFSSPAAGKRSVHLFSPALQQQGQGQQRHRPAGHGERRGAHTAGGGKLHAGGC